MRKPRWRQKLEAFLFGVGGVAFIGVMIYIGYTHDHRDNYYLLPENSRYTIGNFLQMSGSGTSRYPVYEYSVDGKKYRDGIGDIDSRLNYLQRIKGGRALVKYSALDHSIASVVDSVWIPGWVIAPPSGGWATYQSAINWTGAKVDSIYLKSYDKGERVAK